MVLFERGRKVNETGRRERRASRERNRRKIKLGAESLEQRVMLHSSPLPRAARVDAIIEALEARPKPLPAGSFAHMRLAGIPALRNARPTALPGANQVPGEVGSTTLATFTLVARRASYRNEVGVFLVDDASGRIGNLKPGDRGYAVAALSRAQVLFRRDQNAGAVAQLELPAGAHFGTYLVQNGSSNAFLARLGQGQSRPRGRAPMVFFSFPRANADRTVHVLQPRPGMLHMEDQWRGGDRDYNDAIIQMNFEVQDPITPPIDGGDNAGGGGNGGGDNAGGGGGGGDGDGDNNGGGVKDPDPPAPRGFDSLDGWTIDARGGDGSAALEGRRLVLREGTSFEVTASRSFLVPADPTTIDFRYEDLSFDTSDTGFINDAFEVALLGDNGRPVVSTFTTGRDAFFNATEGLSPVLGSHAAQTGSTVTLDVSSLIPGSTATVVFRLVNNDDDTLSSVAIAYLDLDWTPAPASASPLLTPLSPASPSPTTASTVATPRTALASGASTRTSVPVAALSIDEDEPFGVQGAIVLSTTADFLAGNFTNTVATDEDGGIRLTPDAKRPIGSWSRVVDGGRTGANWGGVAVEAETPPGSTVQTRVRAADDSGALATLAWVAVAADGRLPGVVGRFLEIETSLRSIADEGTADIVFIVDESGSMEGEQQWIASTIAAIDSRLEEYGFQNNRYGLVGFADTPRSLPTASSRFMSAQEFATAAGSLSVSRSGYEDGYGGIAHALREYDFRDDAMSVVVLVTDEERTTVDRNIDRAYILAALGDSDVIFHAVLNAVLADDANLEALGVDSSGLAYLPDVEDQYATGSGGVYVRSVPVSGGSIGNIFAHYVDLTWEAGGTVWDLNRLRAGGDAAAAFTTAFVDGLPLEAGNTPVVKTIVAQAVSSPTIEILSPEDRASLPAGSGFVLSGLATAHQAAMPSGVLVRNAITLVTVNGKPVDALDGAGRFFLQADVLPGDNVYEIVAEDVYGQTTSTTLTVVGTQAAGVDFSLLSDISASFDVDYARTSFRRDEATLYADVAVKNVGQYAVSTPLYVAIANLSDPTVAPLDADGYTPDGLPYYDVSALVAGGRLEAGRTADPFTFSFWNPNGNQFDYELRFFGLLNRAPAVTTVPLIEALAGKTYRYDVDASDPDGDPVSFRLMTAPAGMTIDPASGLITWSPAESDLGTHPVVVRADDGRGGWTEQAFDVEAIIPPPNRPPVFTSLPRLDASIGVPYAYAATARDPDFDELTFSLVAGPAGMTVDPTTGLVSWTPRADQKGDANIVLRVQDGRGGEADQSFTFCVVEAPGNHAPIIVSTPVTRVGLGGGSVGEEEIIDLGVWEPVQFDLRAQGSAQWSLSQENTVALQSRNADASILLSDFRLTSDRIKGSWRVNTNNDDDYMGFVFGYQDSRRFYLFDWKKKDQSDSLGFAQRGMSVKVVDADSDLTGRDLWPTSGNGDRVKVLYHNTIPWESFTDYEFELEFRPGAFSIFVRSGSTELATIELQDDTYEGGGFGFYNYSQDSVLYSGFRRQVLSEAAYRYDVAAIDPDGDALTHSLLEAPEGMTINPQTGAITWSPKPDDTDKIFPVIIRVEDGRGGFDIQSYSLNVAISGEIRGSKWNDLNGDGVRDADEPGLAGWIIYLDQDGDHIRDAEERFTVTDGNGDYVIDGLTAGTYFVREEPHADWIQTRPGGTSGGVLGDGYADRVIEFHDAGNGPRPGPYGRNVGGSGSLETVDPSVVLGPPPPNPIVSWNATTAWLALPIGSYVTVEFVDEFIVDGDGDDIFIRSLDPADSAGESADIFVSADLVNFVYLGRAPQGGNVGLDLAKIGFTEPVRAVRVMGIDNRGASPGFDLVSVEGLPGSIAPGDGSYKVVLGTGEVASNRDFGGHRTSGTVANIDPEWITTPLDDAIANDTYRYDSRATDPDGDPLLFDLPAAPVGMTVHPTLGVVVWTPMADQVGEHSVVLRVRDDRGGVALQSFMVTVGEANAAPVVVSTPPGPATAGLPYRYEIAAQDAEGDALTFTFEDSVPAGMTLSTDGVLEWPEAGSAGDYPVVVLVTDARGAQTRHAFALKVGSADSPNNAPTATIDARTTAHADQPYTALVRASDPDGDPLSYELITKPDGMTIDAAGLITWTPTADQVGGFDVEVKVSDGRPGGDVIRAFRVDVTTQGVNNAPRLVSVPRLAATVGATYAATLRGSDPDGDPVSFRLVSGPRGMSLDPVNGTIRWTPSFDQLGPQEIVVEAVDPFLAASSQRFVVIVTCVNQEPRIISNPPTTAWAGDPYVYAVRADDPEDDPLTFALLGGPEGMTIDGASGVIRWTPTVNQGGRSFTVAIQVDDGWGNLATQSFRVEASADARNRSPVITSRPGSVVVIGETFSYAVQAIDPEGDPLRFEPGAEFPTGMTIDPMTGVVSWSTSAGDLGSHIVTIAAVDSGGARATQSFLLDVQENRAPELRPSTDPGPVTSGGVFRYDVRATDPNGDPLTYELVDGPAGMTVDDNGRIIWTIPVDAEGSHPVSVVVRDPSGAEIVRSFVLEVQPDVDAPQVVVTATPDSVNPGARVAFQVVATDNVGVASLSLTVGGKPIVLGPDGTASLVMEELGSIDVLASATDPSGNVGLASATVLVVDPSRSGGANPPPNSGGVDPSDRRAPTVIITSPAFETSVSDKTSIIGTVDDPEDRLWYYKVLYARVDAVNLSNIDLSDPDWILLRQGTEEVHNGELAVFDPTHLTRDPHAIIVAAFDQNGQGYISGVTVNVEGGLLLGNYHFETTDLQVPLAGIPITVTRVYDTNNAAREGDFGYGWSLGVQDARILETIPAGQNYVAGKTKVYLTAPDGRRIGFTYQERLVSGSFFGAIFEPYFTPDPGVYETLQIAQKQIGRGGILGALEGIFNPDVFILTTKDGMKYTYDQTAGLQRIDDLNGNFVTFSSQGIRHSSGARIEFARDHRDRITAITQFDLNGAQTGDAIRYQYDAAGDLRAMTDQGGLTTRYEYRTNPRHYLDRVIDARDVTVLRVEYEPIPDHPGSFRFVALRDALGNVVGQNDYSAADANTAIIRDANGNETKLVYDARGNVLSETDSLGNITLREYNDPRNPDLETRIIDARGFATTYTYDARGNVTSITDALGRARRMTYDSGNRLVSETNELGRTTTNVYDAKGNLIRVVDPSGALQTAERDDLGRIMVATNALGNKIELDYGDGGASPSRVLNPGVGARLLEYNRFGQVTRLTDEEGYVTVYSHDSRGLLSSITNANGDVVSFEYDAVGNRTLVRDPLGNKTRFRYDAAGRLVEETDPLGFKTKFAYDPAGNLIEKIDRNGRTTRYAYDRANQLVEETWHTSDGLLVNTIVTTYDAAGNRLSASDSTSTLTFTYDALGRLETVSNAGTPDAPTIVLTYAYDAAGNIVSVVDNLGARVDSVYDERNLLVDRTWSGADLDGARITFGYDANGFLTNINRFSDLAGMQPTVSTVIRHNAQGLPEGITHIDALDAILANYEYSYDRLGLARTFRDDDRAVDYDYDAIGQLISVDYSGNNAPQPDEYYVYDANGNRVESHLHGDGYVTGPGNQLLSDGVFRYEYDPEGNLIRKTETATGTITTYEYDHRNRLVRVEERSSDGVILKESRYVHDIDGRRIAVTTNGATTHIAYNGDNAWVDFDATGAVAARHLFGDNIDELLGRQRGGEEVVWYLVDGLGTVRGLVNAASDLISHVDYDAFGKILARTGPAVGGRFLFTGRELDPLSGLYHYRARSYDPSIGRFTARDPLGFGGGDINLYRYVANSPGNGTDPTGTMFLGFLLALLNNPVILTVGINATLPSPPPLVIRTDNVEIRASMGFPDLSPLPAHSVFVVFGALGTFFEFLNTGTAPAYRRFGPSIIVETTIF